MRIVFYTLSVIFFGSAAQAYVGPGPGLGMIGSFLTLLAGIFIALFFVLLYPIRLFLKRRRDKKNKPDTTV